MPTEPKPPSLFESFLSRHPISDELRRSIYTEVVLLKQAFCDRFKERLDAERIKQVSAEVDQMTDGKVLRHFPRRSMGGAGGEIEIVDREFEFVRAILPYDYRFTSNADQWDHAQRICEALEGPMSSQGVVRVV